MGFSPKIRCVFTILTSTPRWPGPTALPRSTPNPPKAVRGGAILATVTSAARFDKGRLLRRTLLWAALSSGITSAIPPAASAQRKMSQHDAEYQDHPRGGLSCAACSLYRAPRSCQVVDGDISPSGWCKYFDLPD